MTTKTPKTFTKEQIDNIAEALCQDEEFCSLDKVDPKQRAEFRERARYQLGLLGQD